MKSKKAWIAAILALLAVTVAVIFFLRHSPVSRDLELLDLLPPQMDLYAVADIESLGNSPLVGKLLKAPSGFTRDEEYEQFIRESGFHYESDLKRVALARSGADWAGAARVRIDRARVTMYMESHGAEKKDALGKTIFVFGKFRPFLLVFLDENSPDALVAFTVGGDDARIRQVVQSYSAHSSESASFELKRSGDLSHISPGSKVWLIGKADKLLAAYGGGPQVGPLALNSGFFRGSKMLYVSIGSDAAHLNLRAENYCDSAATAGRISGSLQGILALLKSMPGEKGKSADTSFLSLLKGISIEQAQQSVFLGWQLDEAALLNLLEAGSR